MTISAVDRLTLEPQAADAAPEAARPQKPDASAEARRAAQEFEAIFLRQLMKGLETGTGISGAQGSAGRIYGSMMVSTLADSAAQGGGIGLSELVLQALLDRSKTPGA